MGEDFLATWTNFCRHAQGNDNESDLLQEFVFGLWRLWKQRNDTVFKGEYHHPLDILELWKMNIAEFRDARALKMAAGRNCQSGHPIPRPVKRNTVWRKPSFGTFKLNTDAAWCKDSLRGGVGWVARDFAGLLQAAGGTGGLFCLSAVMAEACAIRSRLEACLKLGFRKILVESDANELIQMIRKETSPDFNIECILGDIETLACCLESVTFVFAPRESNRAAHSVAKFVFKRGRILFGIVLAQNFCLIFWLRM